MLFDQLFNLLPIELQEKMKQSPQDRLYHSEGSVYNHSRMVALCLPDEINYQLCALFHDMAKLDCVEAKEKEDKIRIRNIGHENYCKQYIEKYRYLYEKYNPNWEMIEQVCTYHMRMHQYNSGKISRPNKRKAMEELKYFEELKIFAKADEEGRIENGELAQPYLIVTIGLPGSGKSTWRKSFVSKSKYAFICPDDIRENLCEGNMSDQSKNAQVWELAYHTLKYNLQNKVTTIFDSCACNMQTIKSLITIAKEKEAIIMFKIFDTDPVVCKERIKVDIENKVNRSNVPNEVVDKMYSKFPDIVDYIKENNLLIIKE